MRTNECRRVQCNFLCFDKDYSNKAKLQQVNTKYSPLFVNSSNATIVQIRSQMIPNNAVIFNYLTSFASINTGGHGTRNDIKHSMTKPKHLNCYKNKQHLKSAINEQFQIILCYLILSILSDLINLFYLSHGVPFCDYIRTRQAP